MLLNEAKRQKMAAKAGASAWKNCVFGRDWEVFSSPLPFSPTPHESLLSVSTISGQTRHSAACIVRPTFCQTDNENCLNACPMCPVCPNRDWCFKKCQNFIGLNVRRSTEDNAVPSKLPVTCFMCLMFLSFRGTLGFSRLLVKVVGHAPASLFHVSKS